MNLIKSKRVVNSRPELPEQGWLNEVYRWEKFDIGHEYNVMGLTVTLIPNATIFHFAGLNWKPEKCPKPKKKQWLVACQKWKHYREKLLWKA